MAEAATAELEPEDLPEGEALEGAEADAPPANPEAEKIAGLMGWKPETEWRGDKENWRSAEDFLKEVPEINRALRKKASTTDDKFNRIVAQVAALEKTQKTKAEHDALADLSTAVEAGDIEGAKAAALRLSAAKPQGQPDEDPAFTAFKDRNEWYGGDVEATAYVQMLDQSYAQATGGVKDADAHMKRIETAVKKRFPELFEAPKTTRDPPLVGRGGRTDTRPTNGEKTAADLSPAQRKAAADMGVTTADYVKSLNKFNASQAPRQ